MSYILPMYRLFSPFTYKLDFDDVHLAYCDPF